MEYGQQTMAMESGEGGLLPPMLRSGIGRLAYAGVSELMLHIYPPAGLGMIALELAQEA